MNLWVVREASVSRFSGCFYGLEETDIWAAWREIKKGLEFQGLQGIMRS